VNNIVYAQLSAHITDMERTIKRKQFPSQYPQSRADKLWFPRRFGEQSRVRFNRHRRARYLLHNQGRPFTDLQEQVIRGMLVSEWEALKAEAEGKLREARLARGTFRQGLLDFEKTLPTPAMRPARMARSGDYLGSIHQRFGPPR
jgi:hypothetical protein